MMIEKREHMDPAVIKLLEQLRESQAQMYAITEELVIVLGGGELWGKVLKRLEAAFDLAWCGRYAVGKSGQYSWNFKTDRGHMKRFYRRYGEEDLVDRFGVFLRNDDRFFVTARHSFAVFVSSVNQHVPDRRTVERRAEPWSCHHTPRCGSPAHCRNLTIINQARREKGQPLLVEES